MNYKCYTVANRVEGDGVVSPSQNLTKKVTNHENRALTPARVVNDLNNSASVPCIKHNTSWSVIIIAIQVVCAYSTFIY